MFKIVYEKRFEKDLQKLDKRQAQLILLWIKKHLSIDDPRAYGKALQGELKGFWRYRVGNYRIIAEIKDKELIIIFLSVGHRKNIYK